MAINSITASTEVTLGILPGFIFINTSDTLAQVMATGYLNGQSISPSGYILPISGFSNLMMAIVSTSDSGVVNLVVNIDGSNNVNLVAPAAIP